MLLADGRQFRRECSRKFLYDTIEQENGSKQIAVVSAWYVARTPAAAASLTQHSYSVAEMSV